MKPKTSFSDFLEKSECLTVEENKNFSKVQVSKVQVSYDDLNNALHTLHLDTERKARIELAFKLNKYEDTNKDAAIDKVFLVDKNHRDGEELHVVTRRGIIFILNARKFLCGENGFITALIARPNQIRRLYEACNLTPSENMMRCASINEKNGYNKG